MMSSYTITLFAERSNLGPRPASFAASIFFHGLAVAMVWFSIMYKPPIAKVSTEHFPIREVDLRTPDEQRREAASRIAYPVAHAGARAHASKGKSSPNLPVLRQIAQAQRGPQTLVQPDLPNPVTLSEQIPVPQVAIWSPSTTLAKKVVPPLPKKPTASDVQPSVDRPNEETALADVNIASSFHPSPKPLIPAGTTSPIAVHLPEQVQSPPAATSQTTAQPTPASILSLSNLRMDEGTATLPPVNESAAKNTPGVLAAGEAKDLSSSGNDNSAAKPGQAGLGTGPAGNTYDIGAGAGQGSPAKANDSASGAYAGKPGGPETISAKETGDAGADGNLAAATEITLPKDGHFNAVVVGASLQDLYPELTGAWNGRLAYTVYLHVGLARSWVLQYSLPRSADASAGGTIARLDAPWPYNIVRPNLEPGSIDADALMVHGFVNQSGRFEALSVVFPQAFPQAQFVLAALQKWQFRPALQDGQSAKVEVLLIIPEQLE
jgi:hypothetical protein